MHRAAVIVFSNTLYIRNLLDSTSGTGRWLNEVGLIDWQEEISMQKLKDH